MSTEHVENNGRRRSLFRWQAFTSLLLFAVFLLMAASGAVLYISPRGRVAHWTGWNVFQLDKEGWSSLHINTAVAFLLIAVLHLCFNWRMFWAYIKKTTARAVNLKLELVTAIALAVALAVGSIVLVPPFETVIAGRDFFKDYWEVNSPAAPAPHAEEFTLERLGQMAGVPGEQIVAALSQQGFEKVTLQTTVAQAASSRGITPHELFETLAEKFPPLREAAARRGSQGGGFGRLRGRGGGFGRAGRQGESTSSQTYQSHRDSADDGPSPQGRSPAAEAHSTDRQRGGGSPEREGFGPPPGRGPG